MGPLVGPQGWPVCEGPGIGPELGPELAGPLYGVGELCTGDGGGVLAVGTGGSEGAIVVPARVGGGATFEPAGRVASWLRRRMLAAWS
jgi:hypothetical protein